VTANTHSFVVFSDDWGRHPSSCQHLFKRIAENHRVLWVNTIGLRGPRADRFTICRAMDKCRQWCTPVKRVSENLTVLAPIMLPTTGAGLVAAANTRITVGAIRRAMRKLQISNPILWTSVPTAADYLGKLDEAARVYYVTDDYTTYPAADAQKIRHADQILTERADLIFACTEALAVSHQSRRAETIILPHGVELEHFSARTAEPCDLARIPHPRVCFFGLIYEKIDLAALEKLADNCPHLHLVMIGPVKTNVDRLAKRQNVHFLHAKPYAQLPAYLHAVDVLLLPYVLDEGIKSNAPLKIRECLAVGKPTVARRIRDLESLADCLYLYDDPHDFTATVEQAIAAHTPDLTAKMRHHVQADTWQDRISVIFRQLDKRLDRSPEQLRVTTRTNPSCADDYLARRSDATLLHDPRWGQLMKKVYGNTTFYLTAERAGKTVGVLQLVEQQSMIFGRHLTSMPYLDAAGILADDEQAVNAIIEQARKLMRQRNARWVELRHTRPLSAEMATRTDKVTFLLMLPRDPETMWARLKAKVRNQVRKATRSNLTVETARADRLDEFYNLYCRNMRDLGSPQHSRRFFQLMLEMFSEQTTIFIVRTTDRPVAAAVTLTGPHAVHVPWAASDRRYSQLAPNMLLYWSMLSHACRTGAQTFNFGRATRDSGTYRFKTQWGAKEIPLYWHYLPNADKPLHQLRPDNPRYRTMVACWKHMPVAVTRTIGPHLIAKLA